MDKIEQTFANRNSEAMKAFGYRLRNQFYINAGDRRQKEKEWIECLRQIKGLYDPDVQIAEGNSRVYPKITRSKINIVLSRLHEMLFPENDKNWEISPTPEPSMDTIIIEEIAISLITQNPETGEPVLPTAEQIELAVKKYAQKACDKMSSQMDDQFIEMDYKEETKKVLRSGLTFGTGVMKGIMTRPKERRKWVAGGRSFKEDVWSEEVPFYEATRIWDWYPDMSVVDIDKIGGSFERHVMTKHDLRKLMERDDFFGEEIKRFIEEHPDGNYVPANWELDLQAIDVEMDNSGSGETTSSDSYGSTTSNRQMGKKYELLEFWGYVDGNDLEACGVDVKDVSLEYGANVWLLGDVPVKAILFDGALDKYKVFYYEKDETSIFGEGLARIMRHSQIAVSAGARMMLDNGACVAGPQVECNISLLAPDTDVSSIYPRKIWCREGKGVDAQYPALRNLSFDSHIDELLKIVETFKNFADEETTLPTWMIGQMVSNETAQAASGRMATITISIKDVVKNFDSFTEKIIKELYAWNMEFNPRGDIKGDYVCKPKGVSSLVMKEIRMQALSQLSATMTDEDWLYVPRGEFIDARFKAHDININLRSEEEVAQMREAQKEDILYKLAIEMQQAEIAYKKAQALAQMSKARDKNVDALIKTQGEDNRVTDQEVATKEAEREIMYREDDRAEEAHLLNIAKGLEGESEREKDRGNK